MLADDTLAMPLADAVPWDGLDRTVDPLSASARDGRRSGRGSADMKGFMAVALAHVPALGETQ